MNCTRRVFLTTASGLALSAPMAAASVQGANSRVRVAIIGTGGRARGLMSQLNSIAGVEIVAICDVFEPRLLQAAEIAGPAALKTAEYRRILDNREIDAVLIGTPDHWHKIMTLDAVAAGKDVYVEKPVSHTIEEGAEMVRVIEASKQVVQTGTQQRSWSTGSRARRSSSPAGSGRLPSCTPIGINTRARATGPPRRPISWTGSAGSARRRTSRSAPSVSTSGVTTGTSAAAASRT